MEKIPKKTIVKFWGDYFMKCVRNRANQANGSIFPVGRWEPFAGEMQGLSG